jgi:DNA-binding transcriptional MocR family regulator
MSLMTKANALPAPESSCLYERTARRLAALIDGGTFRPGDRLPSVRVLARNERVSISTVLEAYRLLEDGGRIAARPKSGYYVTAASATPALEPRSSRPSERPTKVSVAELVMMLIRDTRNPSLVPLGAAIPDPGLLPTARLHAIAAGIARRHPARATAYEVPPGSTALRTQIARRALTAGCVLAPEDIVITSGGQEAMHLALRAVCKPGDTVAIESPIYFGILQAIEALGLRAIEIPTHPRAGMDVAALAAALERNPIKTCVFIPSFSNPLGSLMPVETKQALVELSAKRDLPLIECDIYGELPHSGDRPPAAKSFDKKGLVLLYSSYSKVLDPGFRVGWIAPGRFRAAVEREKLVTNIATATLPQLALAEFFSGASYERHLRKVRRVYARNVAAMAHAIATWFPPGTRVTRPSGGFVLWVELQAGVDSLAFYERALKAGISIAPGSIFSAKQGYRNFIRLNAARFNDQVERAVATLGRLLPTSPKPLKERS